MKVKIQFDVNDRVRIKLTEAGIKAHDKYCKDLKCDTPAIVTDEDGFSEWQLWQVMNIFEVGQFVDPPYGIIELVVPS